MEENRDGPRPRDEDYAGQERRSAAREGLNPFKLVPIRAVSTSTVECLRELLRDAEEGLLIGHAFVSMYKSKEWDYGACGEAHRNPAWSLGMLQAFSAKLASDINDPITG